MEWYPWLNTIYRQILSYYRNICAPHALLLHGKTGNGEKSLCYALSRWFMCHQPNGIKSCGICHSCKLMIAKNHPDFYQIEPEKNKQVLGIDSIRTMINNIYNCSWLGGLKIVCLLQTELLTEQAANTLLKSLEEPPKDTYFILFCQSPIRLLATLRSRCICWSMPVLSEKASLNWLKRLGYNNLLETQAALRLCYNSPLAAKFLLQKEQWNIRKNFYKMLQDIFITGDFLTLLPILHHNRSEKFIYLWLLSILSDAVKWQHGVQNFLVNVDKISFIKIISECCSTNILHAQWQNWLNFLFQCEEFNGINHELLITYYLLNWEQNFS